MASNGKHKARIQYSIVQHNAVHHNAVQHNAAQTNASINAIMCVPKHSYGIGIKRDVTVKMHEYGEENQVRVNTTWRTKCGVIDATSIVRISTTD